MLEEPLRGSRAEGQLAEAEAKSEGRLAALGAERDEITQGRKEAASHIPKPIFRRYERLRTQLHPTLVAVRNGVCQGCRMELAPQLYNQVIRGDDFYQCQMCNRFVYHPDVVAEPGDDVDDSADD
ncbi:MAG: C4-type zinc ribbon domain-containing protein [Sandaracinaceae bacterium]